MVTVPNYPLPPDDRFTTEMVEVVAEYFSYKGYEPYIGEGTPDFERLRAALRWFLYADGIDVDVQAALRRIERHFQEHGCLEAEQ